MQGAELVCTTWRRGAVDEPLLWRRIDMAAVSTLSPVGRAVARAALDRGAGQCEAFTASCGDDMLLLPYLVDRYLVCYSDSMSHFYFSSKLIALCM